VTAPRVRPPIWSPDPFVAGYAHGHADGYREGRRASEADMLGHWRPLAERIRRLASRPTWAEVAAAREAAAVSTPTAPPHEVAAWVEHGDRWREHTQETRSPAA